MRQRDNPAQCYRLKGRIGSVDRFYVVPQGPSRIGSSADNELMIARRCMCGC